jgi:hypothetical protein
MVTVNAKDFGLMPNAEQLQHAAIQQAIDYCFAQGGGEVVISKGNYRLGDIRLRSHITLRLESGVHLMGSQNPEDYFNHRADTVEPIAPERITDAPYVGLWTIHGETQYEEDKPEYRFRRLPASRWNNALIRAIDAQDVKVIGERDSIIDGMNCFDPQGEEEYRGPHGMTFYNCKNVELRGYTMQQSGNWAHWFLFSENITMDGVQTLAGHDGVDFFTCRNLVVRNCEFHTGDDCIAGFGNVNVHVADCLLNSSCSAMRFGATNALIERCCMEGPGRYCFRGSLSKEEKVAGAPSALVGHRNNMLSAFTYYADYSMPIPTQPGNILITDCEFKNADRFLHYNFSGNETWQRYRPLDSIEFRNIKATNVAMPINAYGTQDVPLSLTLRKVSMTVKDEMANKSLIHACHYKSIVVDGLDVQGKVGNLICKWSDGAIAVNHLQGVSDTVVAATEPFFAKRI